MLTAGRDRHLEHGIGKLQLSCRPCESLPQGLPQPRPPPPDGLLPGCGHDTSPPGCPALSTQAVYRVFKQEVVSEVAGSTHCPN